MSLASPPVRRLNLVHRHLLSPRVVSVSSVASPIPIRRHSTASSSSSSSSNKQKYPYTFTTSYSYYGKNSPTSKTSSQVEQGLPLSHPLVSWRDQILQDGTSGPKHGAGHDWFFVEGLPRGKEELGEGEEGVRGVVMGVADGVGGWEEQGVDPSHFSQALMYFARERVRLSASCAASRSSTPSEEDTWTWPQDVETRDAETLKNLLQGAYDDVQKEDTWTWPQDVETRDAETLKNLLQGAYDDVQKEKGIVAGSSTACLAALDAETGVLHAANLGDSGFYVFRPSAPSASSTKAEPPSSSPSSSSPSYTLRHKSIPQIHFFNAPYQLSKFPQGESTDNALLNYPQHADSDHRVQLEDGDVVVLVTDGFSDNVFEEGEADLLLTAVRQKLDEAFALESGEVDGAGGGGGGKEISRTERDNQLASSVARTAVSFARMIAVREDKVTPFEVEARRWKVGFKGGKVDDVTVLVAVVRKEERLAEGEVVGA
ncbi:hypothetical protein JCM11641_000675 [Rhodosporidiobolus odoratus]